MDYVDFVDYMDFIDYIHGYLYSTYLISFKLRPCLPDSHCSENNLDKDDLTKPCSDFIKEVTAQILLTKDPNNKVFN